MNPSTNFDGVDAGNVDACAHDSEPRMECRICWYLYDPAEGDPVGPAPPGTPFDDLPAEWCCPRCDSDKSYFLPAT